MKKALLSILLVCGCIYMETRAVYAAPLKKTEISEQELQDLFQYLAHTVQQGTDPAIKIGLPVFMVARAKKGHVAAEDLLSAYGSYAVYEGFKKLFEEKTGHALELPALKEDSFQEHTKTRRLVELSNYGICLTNKTLDVLGPIFVQALLRQGLKSIAHER